MFSAAGMVLFKEPKLNLVLEFESSAEKEMVPVSWLFAATLNVVFVKAADAAVTINFTGDAMSMFGKLNENSCSWLMSNYSPSHCLPKFTMFTRSNSLYW